MGASVGADDEGSVNVELNVVPFIDLMSCLTAFLLVTAVWSQYAQINIKPKGLGKDATKEQDVDPPVNISVLLTKSEIWVGLSSGDDMVQIRSEGENYDWGALEEKLQQYRDMPLFLGPPMRSDIEIAAEDEVTYQNVINAMDYAIGVEFRDIGYVDPTSLSTRFKE
jgi:biopolymer transport protein ExbD